MEYVKKMRHNRKMFIARALKLQQKIFNLRKIQNQFRWLVQINCKRIQRHCLSCKNIDYKHFIRLKETFRLKYNKVK